MIYIITHIPYKHDIQSYYETLKVGDMFDRPEQENINHLNKYINELTGLYQLWKNYHDKYLGLAHYRRRLGIDGHVLGYLEGIDILKNYDVILAKQMGFGDTLYEFMARDFKNEIGRFNRYIDIICDEDMKYFLRTEHNLYPRNMFFAKKELIDQYCEWLFPKIIPAAEMFKQEKTDHPRMLGYLSERFLTYWVKSQELKVYEAEVIDL